MARDRINLLLIEDNPGDARLIKEMLREAPHIEFLWMDRLSSGIARLDKGDIDVVLVDLGLPDAQGLEAFTSVYDRALGIPVIVITGRNDEEIPIEALKAGAQDYLVKGHTDAELLVRSVRYAIERQRLLAQLDQARAREERARESRAFDSISAPTGTSMPPQGRERRMSLRQYAKTFEQFVEQYGKMLDLAVEERQNDVDHNISQKLHQLAEDIGSLRAGPRDVVEIHRTALTERTEQGNSDEVRAYTLEGRFLVLELMGHLVSYYRAFSLTTQLEHDAEQQA